MLYELLIQAFRCQKCLFYVSFHTSTILSNGILRLSAHQHVKTHNSSSLYTHARAAQRKSEREREGEEWVTFIWAIENDPTDKGTRIHLPFYCICTRHVRMHEKPWISDFVTIWSTFLKHESNRLNLTGKETLIHHRRWLNTKTCSHRNIDVYFICCCCFSFIYFESNIFCMHGTSFSFRRSSWNHFGTHQLNCVQRMACSDN